MSVANIAKSIVSPTTTTHFFRNASTAVPKSILKRPAPAPLPLSPNPFPFAASFNIMVSPALGSPHVHFPNTPSLTSMFSTHSPSSYDRAAIIVSPNPLALPAWGDRVFSPSTGSFKRDQSTLALASPMLNKPVVTAVALGESVVVQAPPKAKNVKAAKSERRARFQENVASAKVLPRDNDSISTIQFPKSPYPSMAAAAAAPTSKDVPRTLKPNRPAALGIEGSELSLAQNAASPLRPSFMSPLPESSPAARLSDDFWRSVSVSEELAMEQEPEFPETPMSAVPRFLFGAKNGGLWSPGLPKKAANMNNNLLSPLARTTFADSVTGDQMLSPAPKDPFASYPSFGMVLAGAADAIKYPAPVLTN